MDLPMGKMAVHNLVESASKVQHAAAKNQVYFSALCETLILKFFVDACFCENKFLQA